MVLLIFSVSLSLSQATAVYQAKEKLKSIDKAKKGKLGTPSSLPAFPPMKGKLFV